jgi:hypothetical protein
VEGNITRMPAIMSDIPLAIFMNLGLGKYGGIIAMYVL